MDKVIVYNQEDGIMAVCIPANNSGLSIEEIAEKDVPKGIKYKIIDRKELSHLDNSIFRDAWVLNGKMKPIVNMEKAKKIWKDIIRQARKIAFEDLDIQYMRATEAGDDTTEIVSKKQKLRDFTNNPEIESANTIEELQIIWDNDLGENKWHKQS
jgi:hypothetical protein